VKVLLTVNVRWWNAEAAYAWEKAIGLRMAGHDVAILGTPGSPVMEKAAGGGFRTFPEKGFNTLNPMRWFSAVRRLRVLLRSERFEIVDAHRSEGFVLMALAVRGSGAVLVRTRGDMRTPRRDPFNRFAHVYGCRGLAASGRVVAEKMADTFNLPLSEIEVIYYGVDAVHFSPGDGESLRREWGVGRGDFLTGMIGRVDKVKGLGFFLQAAAKVARERPRARFLVAVKEEHRDLPVYRDMIDKLGLRERVVLLGYRDDIEKVYRALDAVVVSSIGSEANCRVTLEAMASGIPVVATGVGVIPEVLEDGKSGYLAKPGDAASLVECLEDLLDTPLLAEQMGAAARRRVEERFSRPLMARRVVDFYERVSGGGGTERR
jgi:glycosyltransferase involved in cell wall biosynthesis